MIGIICNYYIRNYGSVLQCLALQYKLKQLGVENEIIQYQEQTTRRIRFKIFIHIQANKILNPLYIRNKLESKIRSRKDEWYLQVIRERNQVFQEYVRDEFRYSVPYKSVNEIKKSSEQYQTIILGSDQLWCPSDLLIGYHTLEWIPKSIYTATYGTSFGVGQLNSFFEKRVMRFISKIDKVSVRELSGQKIIEKASGRKVNVVLDPTLLIERKDWDILFKNENVISERYIFCYFLSNDIKLKKWANELKSKTGLRIVTIPHLETYDAMADEFGDIKLWKLSPGDLINLIRNAQYILSDSFHVSIFSIIYNKKFLVFDRYKSSNVDSRNTRIDQLLSLVGLHDRHYVGERDLLDSINSKISSDDIDKKLIEHRKVSVCYLESVIRGEKKNEFMGK